MRPPDDDMLDPEMEAEFAELTVLLAAERREARPRLHPRARRPRCPQVRAGGRCAVAPSPALHLAGGRGVTRGRNRGDRRRRRDRYRRWGRSFAVAAVGAEPDHGGVERGGEQLQRFEQLRQRERRGRPERRAAPSVGAERAPAAAGTTALTPPNNGRKIIQSAQLMLTAAPAKVESVAQQVFDVVGRESGVVRSSNVTATGGLDSSAEFELSVPSSSLADTMIALSRLHDANVASRTDSTTDVNDRSVSLTRQLADARALRTGLLGQLAHATTQTEIDSLHARIGDAESSIASLESRLRSLDRAVSMSRITLTINAAATPAGHRGSSSFTLGKAAHDAGRVLTVAAGVALITLAVLVPVALLVGIAAWVAVTVRQRRRERSLDVA